jgi:hypothetical protein
VYLRLISRQADFIKRKSRLETKSQGGFFLARIFHQLPAATMDMAFLLSEL